MKKAIALILAILLLPALTACGKSEFGPSENTGKQITITAENAARDAFFMTGSLDVAEGEQIVITANLAKGSIRVEIIKVPGEQSADKLPELDGEAILTAELDSTEGASGTVPSGWYMVKATCLERATGTVRIEVKPAGGNEAPQVVGGWTLTEDAALTEEAQGAFDKAMDGLVGVNYTPIALLGTQLVSGRNYCIVCEAAVVYPGAQPYYAVVTVYQDLQGKAEVRNIVALDLGKIEETGTIEDSQPAGGPVLGGWSVDRESYLEVPDGVMHLASQVVAGTNHAVLCKGWKLCFVYADTQGKTEILKTVPLDIAALSQPQA